MPEEYFLIGFEEALADEVNQPSGGTSRVDGVKQDGFVLGKKQDSFFLSGGHYAVTSSAIGIIHEDIIRMEMGFQP